MDTVKIMDRIYLLVFIPVLLLLSSSPDRAREDVHKLNIHLCGDGVIKLKKGETRQYVIGAAGNETLYIVQDQSNPEKVTISPTQIGSPFGGVGDGIFDVTGEEPGTNTIVIYWNSIIFEEELAEGVCEVKVRVASPDINSTGDSDDVDPGDGMCDTDGLIDRDGNEEMECTLRAAITEANASPGADLYRYRIPTTDTGSEGGGKFRISPGGGLPSVSDPLTLDGQAVLAKTGSPQAPTASITIDGAGLVLAVGSNGSKITGHTIINAPGAGIQIDADACTIESSFIGITQAGGLLDGNGGSGVLVNGDNNMIGGDDAARQNIIAGNTEYGVEIHGTGNQVRGNWIGVSLAKAAVANKKGGILIRDGNDNTIGGSATAAGAAPGNVISGNELDLTTGGIFIFSDSNTIQGNIIGLDPDGTKALGQNFIGIALEDGADNNTIGGTSGVDLEQSCKGDCNLISGNVSVGVRIRGVDAKMNTIKGNYIGTLGSGTCTIVDDACDVGNTFGIQIRSLASENTIGGSAPNEGNLISGNKQDGITSNGKKNKIFGNRIGTNNTGLLKVPNKEYGIFIDGEEHEIGSSDGVTVSGACTGACNLISGNKKSGIRLDSPTAFKNIIQGNFIGLDKAGTGDLGNTEHGIEVRGTTRSNLIGGNVNEKSNLIAGNDMNGIHIEDADSVKVFRNFIGQQTDGITALPNKNGISIMNGSHSRIGSEQRAHSNTITKNDSSGVVINGEMSEGNRILINEIWDNKGLAIDLGADGPTANDLGDGQIANMDADTGPNKKMNFPVGLTASPNPSNPSMIWVSAILDSPSPEKARVDIYNSEKASSRKKNETSFGEGQKWLGWGNPSDKGFILIEFDPADIQYPYISATATDENGNTSEFSWVCVDTDGNGSVDNDADALCDDWETRGIDYDGDGTIDLNLKTVDSNKSSDIGKKDIFVELDYMGPGGGHAAGEMPVAGAITDVKTAFSNNNINLHLMVDEAVPHAALITFLTSVAGAGNDFNDYKLGSGNKPCGAGADVGKFGTSTIRANASCAKKIGARRLAFRYGLFVHDYAEAPGSSGISELPGNDFLVALGSWTNASMAWAGGNQATNLLNLRKAQAGTLMHEFGHSLNLRHGGGDNVQWKPNYPSVMNYMLQFLAAVPNRTLDYSRESLPSLTESTLNETNGLGGTIARSVVFNQNNSQLPGVFGTSTRTSSTTRPIDWNGDGDTNDANTNVDLNYHGTYTDRNGVVQPRTWPAGLTTLTGHDDWNGIHYNFRSTFDYSDGVVRATPPPALPEMDEVLIADLATTMDFDDDGFMNSEDNCGHIANPDQLDEDGDGVGDVCQMGASDLGLLIDATPSPADVLVPLNYAFTIENFGPDSADNVTLIDSLDLSLSLTSIAVTDGFCSSNENVIVCDFGTMGNGDKKTVTLTVTLSEDRTVFTQSSVTSGSLDPNPANNKVNLSVPVAGTVDTEDEVERGQELFTFKLHQNYPNPFGSVTTINYDIETAVNVRLDVVNLLGQTVRTLVEEQKGPGRYSASLDGRDLPAGIYFYRIRAGSFRETKRLVIVR